MAGIEHLPEAVRRAYEIVEWHHALAVLCEDFPTEWDDLMHVLQSFSLGRSSILEPGGRKSPISVAINGMFDERGWEEKSFDVRIIVDEAERETPTHKVDYYKNRIAVENEWNNKDPFFDRDLNNFRLLCSASVGT